VEILCNISFNSSERDKEDRGGFLVRLSRYDNMAYLGTVVAEAEIAIMSGENVDATGDTEANHNVLVDQAESFLSNLIGDDVVAGFAGYGSGKKNILAEWAARYTGMSLIAFNMAGYSDREEAEDMINIHLHRMEIIEKILLEQGRITFLTA